MSQNVSSSGEPISSVACIDWQKNIHAIHMKKTVMINEISFLDKSVQIQNLNIPHVWFSSISICTKNTFDKFKNEILSSKKGVK